MKCSYASEDGGVNFGGVCSKDHSSPAILRNRFHGIKTQQTDTKLLARKDAVQSRPFQMLHFSGVSVSEKHLQGPVHV